MEQTDWYFLNIRYNLQRLWQCLEFSNIRIRDSRKNSFFRISSITYSIAFKESLLTSLIVIHVSGISNNIYLIAFDEFVSMYQLCLEHVGGYDSCRMRTRAGGSREMQSNYTHGGKFSKLCRTIDT